MAYSKKELYLLQARNEIELLFESSTFWKLIKGLVWKGGQQPVEKSERGGRGLKCGICCINQILGEEASDCESVEDVGDNFYLRRFASSCRSSSIFFIIIIFNWPNHKVKQIIAISRTNMPLFEYELKCKCQDQNWDCRKYWTISAAAKLALLTKYLCVNNI